MKTITDIFVFTGGLVAVALLVVLFITFVVSFCHLVAHWIERKTKR